MITKNGRKVDLTTLQSRFDGMRKDWQSTKRQEVNRRYAKAAEVQASYKAASETRHSRDMRGAMIMGTSADYHYQAELDYFKIVEIARDIDRDDMVVGQAIDRLCNNIMQQGFALDPKTGNRGADSILRYRWETYAASPSECDFQRERNFEENAWLALRHAIVDGDVLAMLVNDGSVQLVENHRLRTPQTVPSEQRDYLIHGVLLNEDRKRLGYYLTNDDISLEMFPDYNDVSYFPKYDRRGNVQVIHLYHPKRVTQTRGVSKLVPVIDASGLHDDIQFAKLVQQQGVSVWSLIREREMGFELPDGVSEDGLYWESDPCREGQTRPMRDVSPGMWYTTYPGEKVHGFSPNVPNPTFFDHAKQIMQLIAINLDLPLILFLMDASETNFSGWRGAMEQGKIAFKRFQRWIANAYHSQVYRWKVRQWSDPRSPLADPLLVRLREAGVPLAQHDWVYPTWPYVEPLTDVEAALKRLQNGLASHTKIFSEMSMDWDVASTQIVEDRATAAVKAIERAAKIKASYPDEEYPPTWRELCPFPMQDGVQSNIAPDSTQEPEPMQSEATDDA